MTVNAAATYQTIVGWEGVAASGHDSAYWGSVGNRLLTAAVDDVGLTRVRLEVVSGAENTSGDGSGEAIVNDNNDPFSINAGGFRWGNLDYTITKVIVPLRALMAARGKTLYVSLCYVSFKPGSTLHGSQPQEYAEFIEATFLHISSTFGFVPDAVEIILEPDNSTGGFYAGSLGGTRIGEAIKATGDRLAKRGWNPEFIAPSFANAASGVAQDYLGAITLVQISRERNRG